MTTISPSVYDLGCFPRGICHNIAAIRPAIEMARPTLNAVGFMLSGTAETRYIAAGIDSSVQGLSLLTVFAPSRSNA